MHNHHMNGLKTAVLLGGLSALVLLIGSLLGAGPGCSSHCSPRWG